MKRPRYLNFSGPFTIQNIIPALDKVQVYSRVRTLSATSIKTFEHFIKSSPLIVGISLYGGYIPIRREHFCCQYRTALYYNVGTEKGHIIREAAKNTYDGKNPNVVIQLSKKDLSVFDALKPEYYFECYKPFALDEINGYTYLSY